MIYYVPVLSKEKIGVILSQKSGVILFHWGHIVIFQKKNTRGHIVKGS